MKEVPKYVIVDKAWGIVHVEKRPRSGGSATFTTPPTPPTPPGPPAGGPLIPPQGGDLIGPGGGIIFPV